MNNLNCVEGVGNAGIGPERKNSICCFGDSKGLNYLYMIQRESGFY